MPRWVGAEVDGAHFGVSHTASDEEEEPGAHFAWGGGPAGGGGFVPGGTRGAERSRCGWGMDGCGDGVGDGGGVAEVREGGLVEFSRDLVLVNSESDLKYTRSEREVGLAHVNDSF